MPTARNLGRTIFAACLLAFLATMATPRVLRAAPPADSDGRFDPVADPRAIVTVGHARFTILTPQLIRMEWAADAKFEDHASLVFLNRKLPVPQFTQESASMGGASILYDSNQRAHPEIQGLRHGQQIRARKSDHHIPAKWPRRRLESRRRGHGQPARHRAHARRCPRLEHQARARPRLARRLDAR